MYFNDLKFQNSENTVVACSELFSTGIVFFVTSEGESAAFEHCYWCEEGYKRKTVQSDYTLMCQFTFS